MNDDAQSGPGAAPSGDLQQLPSAEEGDPLARSAPRRKLAWSRPTVRIVELERTASGNEVTYGEGVDYVRGQS